MCFNVKKTVKIKKDYYEETFFYSLAEAISLFAKQRKEKKKEILFGEKQRQQRRDRFHLN